LTRPTLSSQRLRAVPAVRSVSPTGRATPARAAPPRPVPARWRGAPAKPNAAVPTHALKAQGAASIVALQRDKEALIKENAVLSERLGTATRRLEETVKRERAALARVSALQADNDQLRGQLSSLRASARRALTTASVAVASKPSAKRPVESRKAKTSSSAGVSRRGSGAAAGSRHQHPATADEAKPRQARESSPSPPPPPPPSSLPPTSRASRAEHATRLSSVGHDKQFGLSGSRGVASPASSSSGSSSSSGGGVDPKGRGSGPGTPHGTMSMSRRSAGLNRSVSSEPLPSQTAYERYERLKHLYVSKYR
jgi:hypothetical protein